MQNSQPMAQARVVVKHRALAILGLMIGAFVGMLSETALNIALPSLISALHVSQGTVQWLVTGYMLVIGICMPLSSLLARHFKTKGIVLFALAAFMVGAAVSACANTFSIVLLGRMIQGIGTGIVLPLMFSVALQIFPPHKIGTVMGLAALVIMFAPAVGPTATGLILARFSWHAIFWAFIPFLAIAFILVAFTLENIFPQTKSPVDWLSILLSTVGFGGLVIGVSSASDRGWLSTIVIIALVIGILALIAFTSRQLNHENPILNLRVFSSGAFTVGTLIVMLDFAVILAAMYLLPTYLQKTMGLPVAMTGVIMLPGGLVNALVSAIAGRSFDRFGAKWLSRIGFLIAMVGIIIILMTNAHSSVGLVVLGHIVLMIGAPLAMSPSQTYALNSLSSKTSADGSAILNTLQQIVGACATAIATSMLALGTNHHAGLASETLGAHYGFMFVLVVAFVAFLVSFKVKTVEK